MIVQTTGTAMFDKISRVILIGFFVLQATGAAYLIGTALGTLVRRLL